MCCNNILIFIIILLSNFLTTKGCAACPAYESIQEKSCRTNPQTSLVQELSRKSTSYQNSDLSDNFIAHLSQESLQKVEALQKDPEFQGIVTELQNNSSQAQNTAVHSSPETQRNLSEVSLYIFVSFSMGEKALLNIAQDAKQFGATLVLRGFKDGSYLKTAQALQDMIIKTGQGIIIDPELYTLFNIKAVPTFLLAKSFQLHSQERIQTPIHDKLQGPVSLHYSLETFAKEGDLKDEAQALLKRRAIK